MFYIYVDDERKCPFEVSPCITVRTADMAINTIDFCVSFAKDNEVYVDLDHDLGIGKTGYDVCKHIVENQIPIAGFRIHSKNPVGVSNMRQLLSHYGYKEI